MYIMMSIIDMAYSQIGILDCTLNLLKYLLWQSYQINLNWCEQYQSKWNFCKSAAWLTVLTKIIDNTFYRKDKRHLVGKRFVKLQKTSLLNIKTLVMFCKFNQRQYIEVSIVSTSYVSKKTRWVLFPQGI